MTLGSPHFIYVLVASESSLFAERAVISATTLRRVTPKAKITILSDVDTARLETPAAGMLREITDQWIAEDVDFASPVERSRYLKLNCRRLIDGDYVYLDCDTLFAKDLSAITSHPGDFAAAPDLGIPLPDTIAFSERKGWALPKKIFNSGVMSVRDTKAMRDVWASAYALWLEAASENLFFDQLPSNVAFSRAGAHIHWLPATYNAQIGNRTYAAIKPHVFHIFATFDHDDTIQYHLIRQLKETGSFDQSVIDEFLRTGNPWVRLSSPGQYLALGRPLSAVVTGVRQKLGG